MKNQGSTYSFSVCFFTLSLLLLSVPSYSQRSLINAISWEQFDVPSGKEDLLDNILANTIYDTIIPVEVDYLPDFQVNGLLKFEMPGYNDTISAYAQQVNFFSEDDFAWRGSITSSKGDMMIIENSGDIYGYFFVDSLLMYELVDLGGHSNLLIKFKETFLDSSICGIEEENEPFTIKEKINPRSGCLEDTKKVRILVLYTENAAEQIQPNQKARLFVEQLNMGLDNSQIRADEVFFEISAVQELTGFEETSSSVDDLIALKNAIINNTPDLREETGSDIVVLFVDGNYDDCTVVGRAFQNDWGDPDFGFAIVEGDGGNKYTFAHEVGHTFGCRHHGDHSQDPDYAQGYYWKHDGRKRATIMVRANKSRILHFSNPDVNFDGHVTGFEDFNNNARQLREANDLVADNFCFEPQMIALIEGPAKGVENTLYTWYAGILFCDDIDNYHWEISTNGISYTTYISSSSADHISLYLPTDLDLFIRLTVTCSNDQEVTTFRHVFNFSGSIEQFVVPDVDHVLYEDKTIESLSLSPNPGFGELTVEFNLARSANISLYRYDLFGRPTLITEGYFNKGSNIVLDGRTNGLNGPYYYIIFAEDEMKSKLILFKQ